VSSLLAAAFLLRLAVALWGLDRGFEMGDEGFFLLNLNHPEASPPFFVFYKLLALAPGHLSVGVVEARLLRIAVELAATLALAGGVFAWARTRVFAPDAVAFPSFLLLCLVGSLLHAGSRSLSYNDLTNLCTFAAAGCLFLLVAQGPAPGQRSLRSLTALGAGFLLGFQLGVKFPTALLLLPLAALAVAFLCDALPRRERLRLVALLGLGVLAAVLLFVAAAGGVGPLVATYRDGFEGAEMSGYRPADLLRRYLLLEFWTYVNAAWLAAAFLASLWLLRRLGAGPDSAAAGAFVVGAIALAASVSRLHPAFVHPSLVYLAAFVPFTAIALWLRARSARRAAGIAPGAGLAPWLLLAVLPLAAIAGTNVPVAIRLPSHAAPLFIAIAVLANDLRTRAGAWRLHAVLCVLLIAATSVAFVHHHVLEPYGLPLPLTRQRHAAAGLPEVRVDAGTRSFLEGVAAAMREAGHRPGDPVVAFDYMPGLVYYLRGTSPGFPFYAADRPQLNCFYLNGAGLVGRPHLVLGQPMSPEQHACIRAFDFPEEFRLIGVLRFPYQDVYAGFGLPGLSHVYLYAPRPSAGGAPVEGETAGGEP